MVVPTRITADPQNTCTGIRSSGIYRPRRPGGRSGHERRCKYHPANADTSRPFQRRSFDAPIADFPSAPIKAVHAPRRNLAKNNFRAFVFPEDKWEDVEDQRQSRRDQQETQGLVLFSGSHSRPPGGTSPPL